MQKATPDIPKQHRLEGCYHLDKSFFTAPRAFDPVFLYQIGRLYCKSQTVIGEHAHANCFELTIATGGKGIVYTNGVAVPISRGEIYLSFPWDRHAIASDASDPLKYDYFAFSVRDAAISADLASIMERHVAADARTIHDEQIANLVSTAIAELDGGGRYSERLLSVMFLEILVRLVRGFFCEAPPMSSHSAVDKSNALCYRLMHYIDTHIYEMESLEALSAFAGYNYSYLSALFHKTTSESLASYYRERRLEIARLHIAENHLSITAIAELLRYSSIYTFSRAFKARYGDSPEQYRKKMLARS